MKRLNLLTTDKERWPPLWVWETFKTLSRKLINTNKRLSRCIISYSMYRYKLKWWRMVLTISSRKKINSMSKRSKLMKATKILKDKSKQKKRLTPKELLQSWPETKIQLLKIYKPWRRVNLKPMKSLQTSWIMKLKSIPKFLMNSFSSKKT